MIREVLVGPHYNLAVLSLEVKCRRLQLCCAPQASGTPPMALGLRLLHEDVELQHSHSSRAEAHGVNSA